MNVGFVGVGNIGGPICLRLLNVGYSVSVFDTNAVAVEAMAAAGATIGQTAADISVDAKIVFTCLPTPHAVSESVQGENGILSALAPGSAIVDLSTNDPAVVQRLAAAAQALDIAFADSPVSGGVPSAVAGTVTLFVGADDRTFADIAPVLEAFSAKIFHVGAAGAGSVVKLGNNLLAFANLATAAEAFLLAKRAGVDPGVFLEALESGSGQSTMLERFRRKILPGDFSPEFTLDLALKDVSLALALADAHNVPMTFGGLVKATVQQARALGFGADDCSALVRALERVAGEEIRETEGAPS